MGLARLLCGSAVECASHQEAARPLSTPPHSNSRLLPAEKPGAQTSAIAQAHAALLPAITGTCGEVGGGVSGRRAARPRSRQPRLHPQLVYRMRPTPRPPSQHPHISPLAPNTRASPAPPPSHAPHQITTHRFPSLPHRHAGRRRRGGPAPASCSPKRPAGCIHPGKCAQQPLYTTSRHLPRARQGSGGEAAKRVQRASSAGAGPSPRQFSSQRAARALALRILVRLPRTPAARACCKIHERRAQTPRPLIPPAACTNEQHPQLLPTAPWPGMAAALPAPPTASRSGCAASSPRQVCWRQAWLSRRSSAVTRATSQRQARPALVAPACGFAQRLHALVRLDRTCVRVYPGLE